MIKMKWITIEIKIPEYIYRHFYSHTISPQAAIVQYLMKHIK